MNKSVGMKGNKNRWRVKGVEEGRRDSTGT
jgi:hypothetical protein